MSRIGESRELPTEASLREWGVARPPRMVKPASAGKERTRALAEPSGVEGDSAHAKDARGTRETLLTGPAEEGIHDLEAGQKGVG